MSDSESQRTDEDERLSFRTSIHSGEELEGMWHRADLKVSDEMFLESTELKFFLWS
jgi:hypothetical protein